MKKRPTHDSASVPSRRKVPKTTSVTLRTPPAPANADTAPASVDANDSTFADAHPFLAALGATTQAVGAYFGHIPPAIARNVAKAVGHVFEIPAAWSHGKATEIRAISDARASLTRATAKALAKQIDIDPAISVIAADIHAKKILRQTVNTAKVIHHAVEELQKDPPAADAPPPRDISEDWLNAFEKEAVDMSSEHMRLLFGKILANEIKRPESFSIRTIKLMGQLDNQAAGLFRLFCTLASSVRMGPSILDSRVITVSGSAANNSLQSVGLSFEALNILFEYGLIISDYNSNFPYFNSIAFDNHVNLPFSYAGKPWALLPKETKPPKEHAGFKVNGVALSKAGRELLPIVEPDTPNKQYSDDLGQFFDRAGYRMLPVNWPQPAN